VWLADADPELFAGLTPGELADARAQAVARTVALERGPWEPAALPGLDTDGCLGLLVLEGLLLRSVVVASDPRSELVGPGDVLRPWDQDDLASVPLEVRWQVIRPARLAVLDGRFLAVASRWPRLTLAVSSRLLRRSRSLTVQLAIADLRRVDERLMLFFWHVADRWGHVGPDGITVPLPVTHEVLSQLVCAQRPTVTSALKRLADEGRLRRNRDRTWLLAPEPPHRRTGLDV
jgi:hypothetical protein